MAFSPDGSVIASGSVDRTVRLWDAGTGEPVGEPLAGHTDIIRKVAFLPGGATVMAAGDDGTVRRWDTRTGKQIGEPLTGHSDKVDGVAFSPDGTMIAAAGTDQTVRLWPLDVGAWVDHACTLADRNLTQAEWDAFLGPDRPYTRTCPDLPPGFGADG